MSLVQIRAVSGARKVEYGLKPLRGDKAVFPEARDWCGAPMCESQLRMSREEYLRLLGGRERGARWRREGEALLWPEPVEWDAASDFTA